MRTACIGCGGSFDPREGSTHDYMLSSPPCWDAFNTIIAAEFNAPELMPVHRLSVDAFAVQHPGLPTERRAVQSVGLHLARLMVQLEGALDPVDTNAVMILFAKRKASLKRLDPPSRFRHHDRRCCSLRGYQSACGESSPMGRGSMAGLVRPP